MVRPVTIFTGQWTDLSFEEICNKASKMGYDGVEIACWGSYGCREGGSGPGLYSRKKKKS